jgi:hypothetical protein
MRSAAPTHTSNTHEDPSSRARDAARAHSPLALAAARHTPPQIITSTVTYRNTKSSKNDGTQAARPNGPRLPQRHGAHVLTRHVRGRRQPPPPPRGPASHPRRSPLRPRMHGWHTRHHRTNPSHRNAGRAANGATTREAACAQHNHYPTGSHSRARHISLRPISHTNAPPRKHSPI